MARALRGFLVAGLVGGLFAVGGAVWADDAGKCMKATKGDNPVVKACAQGGLKEAKRAMKDMVKKGKAAGVKFDCDDCHKDDARYDVLTDDAGEKFKKLLAAVEGKK